MSGLEDKINFLIKYRLKFLFFGKNLKNNHILFYPRLPHHRTIIYKICKERGIMIMRSPEHKFDILFAWQDATFSDKIELNNSSNFSTINLDCLDISKEKVDSTFEKVFGYGLTVNPQTHAGRCVLKSNINAKHDGRIIECPVNETYEDVVFQKIIDNVVDSEYVKDIRVPVFGNTIPLVYHKFKKISDRFTNDIHHVEVHETKEIFSDDEIKNIIRFSKEMNLEYGELDILRNKEDGKIYIVDVNKTPWGPPATISKEKAQYVISRMGDAFINNFLNSSI